MIISPRWILLPISIALAGCSCPTDCRIVARDCHPTCKLDVTTGACRSDDEAAECGSCLPTATVECRADFECSSECESCVAKGCTWHDETCRCGEVNWKSECDAECYEGPVSCCDVLGCGSGISEGGHSCYWDENEEVCVCSGQQCEEQSGLGYKCTYGETQCECECEQCHVDKESCCGQEQCEASSHPTEGACIWEAGNDGNEGKCICNTEQCISAEWNSDCMFIDSQCVCGTCQSCVWDNESCCDYERCLLEGMECYWHEDGFDVCICTQDQCRHLSDHPAESCVITEEGLCECTCFDCQAGNLSCCDEEQCVLPCGWAEGKCYCNLNQCQEAAADGEECEFEDGHCSCAMTELNDVYGVDLMVKMIFHDLSFDSIWDPEKFIEDFIKVAAESTGAEEWQFQSTKLSTAEDFLDVKEPPDLTPPFDAGDAAIKTTIRDDPPEGASASRIVEMLDDQRQNSESHFYQNFVAAYGASGASLMSSVATVEDNTWKVLSIVFILLSCVAAAMAIALCVNYHRGEEPCCGYCCGKDEEVLDEEESTFAELKAQIAMQSVV